MRSLNNLPVELVLCILKGVSLKDILNVTRTTTFLRAVGFSSRSLWKNAEDAHKLPLPMGETLDTFLLSSIGKLAVYAISLSAVWHRPIAHPRNVSYIGPCPSQPRSLETLTSPHATILPGNQWLLIDMDTDSPHIYCPGNGNFLPLGVEGTVVSYAYESSTDGSSIIVAVLKFNGNRQPVDYDRFIDIYILQFDSKKRCRATPHVRRAQSIRIPSEKCGSNINLKGSLVVVSGDNELYIFDWQVCSGMKLSSLNKNLGGEQNDHEIFNLKAYFHPSLPLLVAEKHMLSDHNHSIHLVSFPAEMISFKGPDLTEKNIIWPVELFRSTCIHTLESQEIPHFSGFHRNGTKPSTLDVISKSGVSSEFSYLSVSGLDGPTPETTCRDVQTDPKNLLFAVRATAGHTICLGGNLSCWGANPVRDLAFLRMPSGYGEEVSWVRLHLPEDITWDGYGRDVLAFDDVYGTLLVHDAVANYCIVQY